MADKAFHIAMYPWFALGHVTAFVHMANKLAERGHKISFFFPPKTHCKFEAFNLHPRSHNLHSDHPSTCSRLGIKSVLYCIISSATIGYLLSPARKILEKGLTGPDLLEPPEGFPSSNIKLHTHEAQGLASVTTTEYGSGISFVERHLRSFSDCDAICFKTCREIEGPYCEYVGSQFEKPVIFAAKTVIFCAFGSECVLKKDQFQELVLGLEQTGLPFLVALKPPLGTETIESALPEGFQTRVKGWGLVHGGWVPQQLILSHPSVGCFVTHCGSGSLSEALVNDCQLVLLPNVGDQIINARLIAGDLKIGVEVEKGEEDGLFTKDDVSKAVKAVMDDDSEVGKEARTNHAKWKEFLLEPGLENSYMDGFVEMLHAMVSNC
ncbi:hypothetical protein DITRI_Ditri19aG0043400 [Diplodiscus trichospermus]